MITKEIWKDVVGYEGMYQVSNLGHVKSLDRKRSDGHNIKGVMLKIIHDKYGYCIVSLCKNGQNKLKKVHRLVAEAFIPNPDNLPQVVHKDDVVSKDNNTVENLMWSTVKDNNTSTNRLKRCSESMSGHKYTEEQVIKNPTSCCVICDNKFFRSITKCAEYYGIKRQTMNSWLKEKHKMPQEFVDMNLHIVDGNKHEKENC